MDVTLLGTGSPLPDPSRAGPATLVRAGDAAVLVDCGRGVLMRLAAAGLGAGAISAVLLTHLHSDHVQDLDDIITTRWATSFQDNPLRVVGPPGTESFVGRTLAVLEDDIGYRMRHHGEHLAWRPRVEVTEVTEGVVHEDDSVTITSAVVDHGVVEPALGFRFEREGSAVAVSGDTVPCDGLDRLCRGASVYVQSVVRRPLVEAVPVPRFRDILDYHSSTTDAGRTAHRAGAGTLVLTHLVPAPAPGTEPDWASDAAEHFPGEIVVGEDLLTVKA